MAVTVTNQEFAALEQRVRDLYLADQIPWVVGYSGGKDSTATLQLVWRAIAALPEDQRNRKPIHVISTDTLVEQPVVAAWVKQSLKLIEVAAREQGLPFIPHRLTPTIKNTFWVNLIGRGYPAPRRTFRWCTSRLKIDPSNRFILDMVARHGEAIVVLGTRKAESSQRAANMTYYEAKRVRDFLSPNASLPNSLVFTPIEHWGSQDVWTFLTQFDNPWGISNDGLLAMYRGATADNDCPLVVDSSTPTCGNSRFGCWVCTLVSADKSMEAMILNDDEKSWMTPLLTFRNDLASLDANGKINDRHRRDFRRAHGGVKISKWGNLVFGPYTKGWREDWLRRVLQVQAEVQRLAPTEMSDISLISEEEIREIRRIWVEEKHEFDDVLPRIWAEVKGSPYPYQDDLKQEAFGVAEWRLLQETCSDDPVLFDLLASHLDVEQRYRGMGRRRGIIDELESVMKRAYFANADEALAHLQGREALKQELERPLGTDWVDLMEVEGLDVE